jgi:hypothetical protein
MNPLLLRHLYSSARRNRFFVFLSIYLFVIAILTALFVLLAASSGLFDAEATISMLDLFVQGRALYWFSSVILMLTAMLLVPVNALGAIAGERENRTLELLVTTTLRPRAVVLGKVGASLLTGSLYILAPFPLLMIGFWLGGVTTTELLLTLLFLVLTMTLNVVWAVYLFHLGAQNHRRRDYVLRCQPGRPARHCAGHRSLGQPVRYLGLFRGGALAVLARSGDPVRLGLSVGLHPLAAAIATEVLGLNQGSWWWLHFTVERFDPTAAPPPRWAPFLYPPPGSCLPSRPCCVAIPAVARDKRVARPER